MAEEQKKAGAPSQKKVAVKKGAPAHVTTEAVKKGEELTRFEKIKKWFREMKAELKKVVWPTKDKLKSTSAVVLLVIVFFAVFLTLIGSGGRWLLDKVGFYDSVATTSTESETSLPDATTAETTGESTDGSAGSSETSESVAASESVETSDSSEA